MLRSTESYKRFSQRHNIKDPQIAEVVDYLERVSNKIKSYPVESWEIFSFLINDNFVLRFYEDDSFAFINFIWWNNKVLFDNYASIWGTIKHLK